MNGSEKNNDHITDSARRKNVSRECINVQGTFAKIHKKNGAHALFSRCSAVPYTVEQEKIVTWKFHDFREQAIHVHEISSNFGNIRLQEMFGNLVKIGKFTKISCMRKYGVPQYITKFCTRALQLHLHVLLLNSVCTDLYRRTRAEHRL